MPKEKTWPAIHSRACAARSVPVASVFVAYCAIVLFAGWRSLGKGPPREHDVVFLLASFYAFALFVYWLVAFKCFRERLILVIGTIGIAKGLVARLAPDFIGPFYGLVREYMLVLEIFALIISFSMLGSALGWRKSARA
jgi:hypothetical protein